MKESYKEQLAIDFGHKPYAGSGDAPGVAWVSGDAGQPLSSEMRRGQSPHSIIFLELAQDGRGRRAYVDYLEKRGREDDGNLSDAVKRLVFGGRNFPKSIARSGKEGFQALDEKRQTCGVLPVACSSLRKRQDACAPFGWSVLSLV